ncbi:restriction endonuclease subunit S [Chryseobacterium oryzae]|uniref:Restriction endonuclease subunit S n=1 Tax=Chryseobacterium oryzae TaxID=2929799 RepID=A0ABY4BE20_9FLAO|nr:restriction endonuclease subunit S [Chryseobacterium oryzae]UOE37305.1 restriction endonuclease subunit S [Chryseobacterium oryzae]
MSYKKLGDYIIEKVEFNDGDKYKLLQGVSNNKYFQKAKTNIIGIDLSKYRVAHYNQFVFNRATTRNGDKISIALRKGESCIVSPSYRIFEVRDENVLHPDYLQMWFTRPEFDRYARFKSHGSAHEFFDMEEMCEVELPIPSIEEQRQIVSQYQSIANKIKVNEQICEKLEATAQALYKHWFVDFEFPYSPPSEGCPQDGMVKGKPYKSSGGKMVLNDELGKEIPDGWEVGKLEDFVLIKNGKIKPNSNGNIPVYGGNGIIEYVNQNNYERLNIIGRVGAYCGSVYYNDSKIWISDNALAGISKNDTIYYDFLLLNSLNLNSKSEGSSHPLLTQGILNNIDVLKADNNIIYIKFEEIVKKLFKQIKNIADQNQILTKLQSLLLSRLAVGEEVST